MIRQRLINKHSTKAQVLSSVKECGLNLVYASDEWRDNKNVVMFAVRQNGNALQYVSRQWRANKEVAMVAVNSSYWALRYVDRDLIDDKDVILCALLQFESNDMSRTGYNFISSVDLDSSHICDDYDIVSNIVSVNGGSLASVSERLRGNKEVVMSALMSGGYLKFASAEIKDDAEMVEFAIGFDVFALAYASDRVRSLVRMNLLVATTNLRSFKILAKHFIVRSYCEKDCVVCLRLMSS